jgi:hypothetical protein
MLEARTLAVVLAAAVVSFSAPALTSAQPIRLHPANPHYFLYRGRATFLVTSGEHYGAVLNPDFDQRTYLRTLARDGLNYTRLFTGSYFEARPHGGRTSGDPGGSVAASWCDACT